MWSCFFSPGSCAIFVKGLAVFTFVTDCIIRWKVSIIKAMIWPLKRKSTNKTTTVLNLSSSFIKQQIHLIKSTWPSQVHFLQQNIHIVIKNQIVLQSNCSVLSRGRQTLLSFNKWCSIKTVHWGLFLKGNCNNLRGELVSSFYRMRENYVNMIVLHCVLHSGSSCFIAIELK